MKPLLVGELNPYGSDPDYALYPYPRRATGHRLASLVMQLEDNAYLRAFDRVNLCTGRWSVKAARAEATRLTLSRGPGEQTFVLLGKRVCDGWGLRFEPFTAETYGLDTYVILPHPSGLNQMWNVPGAFERARHALRLAKVLPVPPPTPAEVLVDLPRTGTSSERPARCANCGGLVEGRDCAECGPIT